MSKNDFGLDASDWGNCALRTAPTSLQFFLQIQTGRHSAFCISWELLGPSWGPPTIGQKMVRSLESYVSGLIAGLQPSKSDFRSFSKLLPGQFLFQIKLFRGPKLPKQNFKAQKSKIELKMSKKRLRARRVRLGKLCFENGSCLPTIFLENTNRAAQRVLHFVGAPPHDRPENGSFSGILCQRFNSRIAAVKIRFSELF